MNKLFFFILCLLTSIKACAAPCDLVGKKSHEPITVKHGVVCFAFKPVQDPSGQDFEDGISAYYVSNEGMVTEISELPYLGRPGVIDDVFLLDVDKNGEDDVVLIHTVEPTVSDPGWGRTSLWFDIIVFSYKEGSMVENMQAEEWFGWGADLSELKSDDSLKPVYKYPYKNRTSIYRAVTSSPFHKILVRNESIRAILKHKSWLYEDSLIQMKTNKYLISGDNVTVDKVQANWCRVNYTGGKNPLQMWLLCDALEVRDDK